MRALRLFVAACLTTLSACGSDVTETGQEGTSPPPAWVAEVEQTLAACDFTTCGDRTIWGNSDDSAARCALGALAEARGVEQTYPSWADGGGWCGSTTDVVVRPDGVAYVYAKSDGVCDDDKVFDGFKLERCTLKAAEFFEECIAELDAPDAPQGGFFTCWYDDWFESCEEVESATCD